MPGPFHGWLYLESGGRTIEVINHARTAAYLQNPDLAIDGVDICDILEFGGCGAYAMEPPCNGLTTWEPMTMLDPAADPAPWYNINYPESGDALGFYVEEWTGLDDGHVRRTAAPFSNSLGSVLGPLSSEGRVQAINVILMARSEEGMEYLFRWLGSTLMSHCSPCGTSNLLFRRFCGEAADPERGVGEQRNVGLSRGLQWENDIGRRGRCFLRRASFVLEAGDPCIYLPSESNVVVTSSLANVPTCLATAFLTTTRYPCRPSCSELTAGCRSTYTFEVSPLASAGPVVRFTNDGGEATIPMRAIVYADPLDIGSANPCGLPIAGEIYLRPLPPYSTLVWDVVGRQVRYRDVTTGIEVETAAYIDANDPPYRRQFALPCGTAHLILEPGDFCMSESIGVSFSWSTYTYLNPHFPNVTLELQERVGCP